MDEARRGTVAALAAFIIWGLAPLYFKAVGSVPADQIVAHRVVWSVVFLALLVGLTRQAPALRRVFSDRRLLGVLLVTALLTGSNWLVFVWAVTHERVLEGSLGYFINPLLSVLLGRIFLGERLRPLQRLAVAIAAVGVAWRVAAVGSIPWIALFLALTFGFYGLLRKRTPVDAIVGLCVETVLVLPLAAGWLAWQAHTGELHWGQDLHIDLLLPVAGVLTATPLMLFAFGARRLPLATIGFLQYLAPSLNFLLAIFVFHEPFDAARLTGFVIIWCALALYTADMLRVSRPPSRA
ncbi:EamA family transporter RarD [Denitromonas iodatirespirans]|uniref:EamA family transporter RarD n=1 Tax=Denitromonas iodatirespirans TaxID=2795389 RepID=A0A944DIY9_DENI1|nr:EamA family transporter RarD [Denitromonas iodatirespirans]MBT0959719.1 EamA family transporter RarD [Denitromonas iodatirespirans]